MIPKSILTADELEELRRHLTLRKSSNNKYGFGDTASTIFLYDDTGDWISVPRAYGMSLMRNSRSLCNLSCVDRTSVGVPTKFTFNDELQKKMPELKREQDRLVDEVVRKFRNGIIGGVLYAPCGCHAAGELVLMADGTRKRVEDVCVGDSLIGVDGPRRVLELHRGRQPMVRITPKKGDPFTVNLGHTLTVMWSVSDGSRRDGELIDISVGEWMLASQNFRRHTVLYRPRVDEFAAAYSTDDYPINPYDLGVLVGDGTLKRSPGITTPDDAIKCVAYDLAKEFGLGVRIDACGGRCPTYRITNGPGGTPGRNGLINALKKLGLWGSTAHSKFVPDQYKYGSVDTRLHVLAGLLDTDGHLQLGCFEFTSASVRLADDVVFISRSLGLAAYKSPKPVNGKMYWRVLISGECSVIPTRIRRKTCQDRKINKDAQRVGIRSTTILPEDDYYGFVVDGDRRYLLGDFTLTHNSGKTVSACKIASEMGVSTLILAHKEFLVDQWRERIALWLGIPKDEVGIIQQDRCEYQGRKIAVAMVQSLIERTYDSEFYRWPGLLIGDECVSGDSVIATDKGDVRIDEIRLRNAKYVLSFNDTTKGFEWKRVLRWIPRGVRRTRTIFFDGGSLRCTDEHPLLTDAGWVKARHLLPGMRILSPASGYASFVSTDSQDWNISYRAITKIEDGPEAGEDVFDLDVEDNHNFVANGLVVHNCHRHGAESWHKAVMLFSSRYRLGLTATPDRKDGMWDIVRYNFGEILTKSTVAAMTPTIYAVKHAPRLNVHRYCWVQPCGMGDVRIKKVYLGKLVSLLADNVDRNVMITGVIMKAIREGRKVMLLTDRLSQIATLKTMISEKDKTVTVGRYVGGMSEEALNVSSKCQVILATFQMAQEALDIPSVDVGILATPHADVEQAVGRSLRFLDGKKQPVIIDIVDDEQHVCIPFFAKRERLYDRKNWRVQYIG
jgi:superfamily II DNA or RNA helicase